MLKIDPSSVRLAMIETSREKVGTNGILRIQLLKRAFKLIIDNLIPDHKKTLIKTILHLPHRELLRRLNSGGQILKKYSTSEEKYKYYLFED
jgi:GAF domain-containing protein